MFRKLTIYLRMYWLRIIIVSVSVVLLAWMISFMVVGNQNYEQLESFSRRNLSAQMGQSLIMFIFVTLIQVPLSFGMYYWLMNGGAMGKMASLDLKKTKVNIKMNDVIGMDDPKREAWELVKLLKDRTMVKKIGGKIVKGTIMLGPPGCGKTYLAKAIATEAGLPFLPAVGSDFVGMFVGQGAARMKSLFKQARALADLEGGCIIFIDEIDSFARPRVQEMGFGGGTSHNATINQFLTELDGLRKAENNIIVIAATNAQESDLDSAITRAGRFERKIHVTRPNLKERKDIFDYYVKKVKPSTEVNTGILARKTLWFSPADIDYMVREASLIALRDSREEINMKDLSEAYDRIAFGMKSNIRMNEKERLWTAYHEAGHAIIGYYLHPTDDVIKATIIPRKGSLGMVASRPQEELYSSTKEDLLADIKRSVAAYVAERIKFGFTSAGVGGAPGADFYTAIHIAKMMVHSYGMGKSGLVGDFSYFTGGRPYLDHSPLLSEKSKELLDQDIQEILNACIKEVEVILLEKRELLDYFAMELYKKEELEYDEIESIFQQFGLKPLTRTQVV